MRYVVGLLVVVLLICQQDYWQWDNSEIWFGFMPAQLGYHGIISIAAAVVWWLATIFCWDSTKDESLTDNDSQPTAD